MNTYSIQIPIEIHVQSITLSTVFIIVTSNLEEQSLPVKIFGNLILSESTPIMMEER